MRYRLVERVTQAVTVLLLVGGCGWALITWGPGLACQNLSLFCPPAPGAQELGAYIDDYLAAAGTEIDPKAYLRALAWEAPPNQTPYRVGRVAAVNIDEEVVDGRLARALPVEIVATNSQEVGTVIWIEWGETTEGTYHTYGSGPATGTAYRGYCHVAVIDFAAGLIVAAREFLAPNPPKTTTASGDVHTEVDVKVVADWVESLPVHDSSSPSPTYVPDTTPHPSPTVVARPALERGESLTLSGDQAGSDAVLPGERIELVAGDYSVEFRGRANEGCTSCVEVTLTSDDVEPIGNDVFVIDESSRVRVGRWHFNGFFALADFEAGTYTFELTVPKGSWTITLTRDS